MPATQRKCVYEGLTLDVDRHYIGSVTATTHQEKGIITLESNPFLGTELYTFVVSRASMADAANQAGDADSSRAPGLTSGLQGSVNFHRGALLLVPQ